MTQAGKYLLLDRLAVGGMAEVFRAKSMGIEGFAKIVAIKRILPALAMDDEFVQMFVEEAKIAGRLRHANIVRILELGKMEDAHFIAMEYVSGKDLKQIFRELKLLETHMPTPMAVWIATQVLAGLDYAHRQRGSDGRSLRIIHRDVSPQNVLVSHDGLVKLIDFGIAKAATRATQTVAGVIKGKLAYMSPEQITGRDLDHRSDVFAATTVLHEMLTGERLFAGGNDIEIIDRVRQAAARPPSEINPEVPPSLDAIVMKGLARDPNDRWDTAGDMQEALMGYVASIRPPFNAGRLAAWMHQMFADEVEAERAHLARLEEIAAAGEPVAMSDATSPEVTDAFADEATIMTTAAPEDDDDIVELSSIVIVEEGIDHFLSGEYPEVSQEQAARELERITPAPLGAPPAPGQPSPGPEVSAPIPLVHHASPEVSAPIPLVRGSGPPGVVQPSATPHAPAAPIAPPRVSQPASAPAPAPPAEEEGGIRWLLLFFVAILSLLIGVGGVVAALYFTGHPLPFLG